MSADDSGTGAGQKQTAKAAVSFTSYINKAASGKKVVPKAGRRRPKAVAATPSTALKSALSAASRLPEPLSKTAVNDEAPSPPTPQQEDQNVTDLLVSVPNAAPSSLFPRLPVSAEDVSSKLQPQSELDKTTHYVATHSDSRRRAKRQCLGSLSPASRSTGGETSPMGQRHLVEELQTNISAPVPNTQGDVTKKHKDGHSQEYSSITTNHEVDLTHNKSTSMLEMSHWVSVNRPLAEHQEVQMIPAEDSTRTVISLELHEDEDASAVVDMNNTGFNVSATGNDIVNLNLTPPEDRGKPIPCPMDNAGNANTHVILRRAQKHKETRWSQVTQAAGETGGDAVNGEIVSHSSRDKPMQRKAKPKAKAKEATTESNVQPKRKDRPKREDTPSDAENDLIDPLTVTMNSLAERNFRRGQISRREKQMREIDWEAVKQRRREEEARHQSTKETQELVDQALSEAQVNAPPDGIGRMHVIDGRIEVIPSSTIINREADAEREIMAMEILEEGDLTARITSRSFMKNNKRFPDEFILPGRGKRWTQAETELFYQGLRLFGTDFQMISHMFPGSTRRSIKTKFTREEREHPQHVRDSLRGQSELATHWDTFLEASQMGEENLIDADAIKKQLEEDAEDMKAQIEIAKADAVERRRQEEEASVLDRGQVSAGGKESRNGKSKEKRRNKTDHEELDQEEGIEILGIIEDDPSWVR